ncbi:MarR family winged helix-turn-helix transcriptional regulator [Sulfobacillus harzensis]|uniref:MarR family transcriptional regulator n=1 Tax=Sulfobacillus harzensis TaxID=2729629 RepID=A0A7Y0L2Q0_9FIRM|nr:MarR family transcriptional regulator [Sulfobacillus harzensis]NMP21988.1 MarR family transcriptional regulator [Sulfobacillus harzensis]
MADRDEVIDRLDAIFTRISRLSRRRMPDDTLTFGQFAVLRMLFNQGPMAMGAIAESLGISLAGATGIIDRLVNQGVVERTRSREDRRVVWVDLSGEGKDRMLRLQRERHQQMKELLNPLGPAEIETLVQLLERVAEGAEEASANS